MTVWKEVLVRNGRFLRAEIVISTCGIKVNYPTQALIRKYEEFNNRLLFSIRNNLVHFVHVHKKHMQTLPLAS